MEKDSAYTMFISADALEDDDDRKKEKDLAENVYNDKNLREQKVTTDEILVDFSALQQEIQMKDFTTEIEAQSFNREKLDSEHTNAQNTLPKSDDSAASESIVATTGEIELLKKEYKIPNYKKRRLKIIFASIMASVLVATGAIAGTYFLFFKQTTIDIFKQISIRAEGVNGKGILVIDPKTSAEKLERVIKELDFNYNKVDGSLSNGDIVTISIDEQQQVLKSSRIVPAKIMYKYIVTGLVSVPQAYDDIKNKDVLVNNANTQVERDLSAYRTLLVKSAKEQRQVELDFNIAYELLETWYMVDGFATSCTTNERRETCASVAYVYKIHASADSTTYYLTEPDDYLIIEYTGIHYDHNNTLRYKLIDIRTEETKEQATKFLVDIGFHITETKDPPPPTEPTQAPVQNPPAPVLPSPENAAQSTA